MNLTELILNEQPLTEDPAEAAAVPEVEQEQIDNPEGTDQPADAPAGEGDASLNENTPSDGKAPPEFVPYKVFAERNNAQQARIEAAQLEVKAARVGAESVEQYQQWDNLAKQQLNPLTNTPFSGIDEYRQAERQIAQQREADAEFEREMASVREQHIEEFGDEYGGRLAALEERTARAERDAQAASYQNAFNEVNTQVSAFEKEFLGEGKQLDPGFRAILLNTNPNAVKSTLQGLRASFDPIRLTPEKEKAIREAGLKEYLGQKAQDKQRVGATPETGGGLPVQSGQRANWREIPSISKILGV